MTTKAREANVPATVGLQAGTASVTNGAPMSRAEAIRSIKDDEAIAEVLVPVVAHQAFTSMEAFTIAVIDALADHVELVDAPTPTAERLPEPEPAEAAAERTSL